MPLNSPTPDAEVAAVLAQFPTTVEAKRVEPLTSHGGLSGARLWQVETADAAFALRQWPAEHPSPERLRFIHAVLAHVYARGLTIVPVPIATPCGETFVSTNGRLWELAPWLPGETSFEREPSQRKIAVAMERLAKFHLASASFRHGESMIGEPRLRGGSPGLTDRERRLVELDGDAIREYRRAIGTVRINSPIDDLAHSIQGLLPASVAVVRPLIQVAVPLQLPLQPCLRDIWHGNLLFNGDEVTGIVDFGAMQVDLPGLDVARLLGSLVGDNAGDWQLGMDAYERIRPFSADEQTAIRAADASGIVLGCVNWLRWLYVERRKFGDLAAVEGRMRSLLPRLQRLAGS